MLEYTKFLVALIAIVNPLGAVPIFIVLTGDISNKDRM
jgi:multiple antibiotic resistance protein